MTPRAVPPVTPDGRARRIELATNSPPVFLVCGYNDRPDISEILASVYLKFKQLKVPTALHQQSTLNSQKERPRLWPAGERHKTRQQMDRTLRRMAGRYRVSKEPLNTTRNDCYEY